jgi:predicted lipoprotein with Yx(FWY)xxD motif
MTKVLGVLLITTAAGFTAAATSAFVAEGKSPSAHRAAEDAEKILTLKVRNTRFGHVLFDGRDRVLYGFTRDRRGGKSQCYGACASAWPVYFSNGRVRALAGAKQSLIGTVKRRNGRLQVTYNGWPLYFYAHEGPREVKCQNVSEFGGLWLVVTPAGTLVR